MSIKVYALFIVALLTYIHPLELNAQSNNSKTSEVRKLFEFLEGTWQCKGAFADGTQLQSGLEFTSIMDGRALLYEHRDRPPNTYQSTAIWTVEASSQTLTSLATVTVGKDSTMATPLVFVGKQWTDRSMILTADTLHAPPFKPNRFIYKKLDEDSFKMTWQVKQKDEWMMGDYLICKP
jgi:hypothetical protein